MSNWGGKRPGAGRPKGSKGKRTERVEELLERIGCDPIEGMALIASNDAEALGLADGETIPITLRAKMYSELAPYVAPKRRATELTIDQGNHQHVIMQLSPNLMRKLYKDRGEEMPVELQQQIEELEGVDVLIGGEDVDQ
jgi:hypothetical protein